MKRIVTAMALALMAACARTEAPVEAEAPAAVETAFTPVRLSDRSVLTADTTVLKVKHGFEGGRVMKIDGVYHLFTSEIADDPFAVKMRLAHWKSTDRSTWERVGTLYESSGDHTGKDPRAALWAPMPIYDEVAKVWNLFYVAYRAAPDTPTEWRTNFEGRIWRAVSTVAGPEGYPGPYKDVGVILEPGPDSDPWEGLQGTDSFFPFKVGDTWYGFYGSAQTQSLPVTQWQVGLASAPSLEGPWKRMSEINPSTIEPRFIENPFVTPLPDGRLVAFFDTDAVNSVGYSFSTDGTNWSKAQHLQVQPEGGWAHDVRTPLGLIDEGDGSYTLFFTAYEKLKNKDGSLRNPTGSISWMTTKLGE